MIFQITFPSFRIGYGVTCIGPILLQTKTHSFEILLLAWDAIAKVDRSSKSAKAHSFDLKLFLRQALVEVVKKSF